MADSACDSLAEKDIIFERMTIVASGIYSFG